MLWAEMYRFIGLLVTIGLVACTPGVIRPPAVVSTEVSREIDSVRVELAWPDSAPEMGGFAASRGEAAAEGAGAAAEQAGNAWLDSVFINECAGAECIAIPLLLPIILPLAAIGNAAFSDSAEEIAAQQETVITALKGFKLEEFMGDTLERNVSARTPYTVTDAADADAVLTVNVRPLDISGENLERQKVRVIMAFDVSFDRQFGSDPRQIYHKRYQGAYEVTTLRDLAAEIDDFRDWISWAARANAFAIAEDLYTGFDHKLQKFEVLEPAVNIVSLFAGPRPVQTQSVTPELVWTPITPDAVEPKRPESTLVYDVRVFAFDSAPQRMSHVDFDGLARARAAMTGDPVYEAGDLTIARHRITRALQPCTDYLWEVRARLKSTEIQELSDWHGYYLEQSDSGTYRQWLPWFATPCSVSGNGEQDGP